MPRTAATSRPALDSAAARVTSMSRCNRSLAVMFQSSIDAGWNPTFQRRWLAGEPGSLRGDRAFAGGLAVLR
jgi:hypothetical protein